MGAMLTLIELQETYKDSGVEVVAVAAHESAASAEEARSKLDAWLNESFPKLNFLVAFDDTGAMNTLWMQPSFSVGIPKVFVIGRDATSPLSVDRTNCTTFCRKFLTAPGAPALKRKPPKGSGSPKMSQKRANKR
ncbi:hypothetical protein EME01_57020 [Sinorhizobium meliloti]|nr:hypothetical protein EME01_57020 [Sinorhizobium meliloti]